MQARVPIRLAAISVVSSVFLIGLARDASAAPLVLDNDVDVNWTDAGETCGPGHELECIIPVFGAPRLVPDAKSVGDQLKIIIAVDFSNLNEGIATFPGLNLVLNVGDAAFAPPEEVLRPDRPGEEIPLRLTYGTAAHGYRTVRDFIDATNGILSLTDFADSGLLPAGDLVFTVDGRLTTSWRSLPVSSPATITLSGPGQLYSVPEPGTLVLLLAGLATTWLGARWRHAGRFP